MKLLIPCTLVTLAAAAPGAPAQPAPPAAAASAAGERQDRADLDRTQIVGNRELPKVLYIVPWKKPPAGGLAGRPVASVLDEALAPIDRDVFRRQIDYGARAQAQAQAAHPSAPTPSSPTEKSR